MDGATLPPSMPLTEKKKDGPPSDEHQDLNPDKWAKGKSGSSDPASGSKSTTAPPTTGTPATSTFQTTWDPPFAGLFVSNGVLDLERGLAETIAFHDNAAAPGGVIVPSSVLKEHPDVAEEIAMFDNKAIFCHVLPVRQQFQAIAVPTTAMLKPKAAQSNGSLFQNLSGDGVSKEKTENLGTGTVEAALMADSFAGVFVSDESAKP